MLGDDDSDDENGDALKTSGEESSSSSQVEAGAGEEIRVEESKKEPVSPITGETGEADSVGRPETRSDASPSERSAGPSEPAAWDRERLSSQIFEMLRGTTEGEKKEFGREAPNVQTGGVQGPSDPSLANLRSVLQIGKRSDGVRAPLEPVRTPAGPVKTPPKFVRTPVESVRTPPGSGRTAADAVRTAPDATEWSEEVQSAVAKAEAEREMARKRQAPDYGTFEELLKEEDGVKR